MPLSFSRVGYLLSKKDTDLCGVSYEADETAIINLLA